MILEYHAHAVVERVWKAVDQVLVGALLRRQRQGLVVEHARAEARELREAPYLVVVVD